MEEDKDGNIRIGTRDLISMLRYGRSAGEQDKLVGDFQAKERARYNAKRKKKRRVLILSLIVIVICVSLLMLFLWHR
jgi:hypothetical protein